MDWVNDYAMKIRFGLCYSSILCSCCMLFAFAVMIGMLLVCMFVE